MSSGDLQINSEEEPRPRVMVMLTGLYLFLLLISLGSFGQPIAFMGSILEGTEAKIFIVINTVICLHLFIGLWQKQLLTWYLLLGYNIYEVINTLVTLVILPRQELERVQGAPIDPTSLAVNNLATVAAIIWVTVMIFRNRPLFCNRSPYLF
jgi:hypothetical protein